MINILGKLPLEYNVNLEYIDNILKNLETKFPEFENIFENYFKEFKYKYFKAGDYNYNKIPIDCPTNSYLENYNWYIKKNLGNKQNLSWKKFFNFIKE